ncbi:MAG: NADH-quinone oxidoreductase subunit N [Phycisphaerales bacterium]
MIERLAYLYPELALFVSTCLVMVLGLSPVKESRKLVPGVASAGVLIATLLAAFTTPAGKAVTPEGGQTLLLNLVPYAKVMIGAVGFILLLVLGGTVDRGDEARIAAGKMRFDPLRSNRAEFYSFALFSLTGLMLCASADDLIWLFLALELTSLPTYIMVAISTSENRGREAGVKYFFLGALGAAIFLYGFTLLYGATGSTNFNEMHAAFMEGGITSIGLAGLLLSILGVGFKIAAVPMHFYTADVYQGAASQVSAFLAFVPKTAGFLSLILILACVGWGYAPGTELGTPDFYGRGGDLPELVRLLLWVMAALTMTVGNVLALLQTSVKRLLAYSSIAHSGYMLVGLIAGPGDGSFSQNGLSAVIFYLLCYGVMNIGTFAVLSALERPSGTEGEPQGVDSIADLRGLCTRSPLLGWTMSICALSLLGLPPLLGFFGKVPLFTSAISAGEIPLVVVLGLNSAIAAFYYLKLAFAPFLESPDPAAEPSQITNIRSRIIGGTLSAAGVIVLALLGEGVMAGSRKAGEYTPSPAGSQAAQESAPPALTSASH